MAYKIGTLTVQVSPADEGFEDRLRAQVKAATDKVNAEVGLRLNQDAVISLNEDVHAALDLATEDAVATVGLGLRDDAVEALDADVRAGVELVEQDAKVKVTVDPKSSQDVQQGMSGLIVGAIGAAAALAAPVLLATVGGAFTGISVLALKNNQVISSDFQRVAKDASAALQEAVAPLAPAVNAALDSVDAEIGTLRPDLDSLFSNVQPDIGLFTTGIENLASGLLPGLDTALGNSHDLVADVSAGLGQLGQGAGAFLTGLTRDSSTTGQGLEAVIGTASDALGLLGNIAGSASSAISADLLAVTPAVDGALTALDKLASPLTVGAAGGALAAWKLGGPLETGLKSVSDGLLGVAVKGAGAGGMLGKISGAAEGASGMFGKMADVMGGPWGLAVGAGVGLLSGLAGELLSTSDATKAVTLNAGDLQKAIGQDGGVAGQATAAYIAASSAADGMSDAVSAAGVSQATWTEAVLGNKTAATQVTGAIYALNEAQLQQTESQVKANAAAEGTSQETKKLQIAQAEAAANANQLSDANQKIVNTLKAQQKQVADSIAAQTKYQQAMATVTNTQSLFNASLTAAHNQLVANAQASALSTVGALDLGDANYSVTSSLDALVTGYTEAQAQGNAYAQVLAALDDGTQTLLDTEAKFTTALSGVTAAAKANGHSLDVNTTKGAANITALSGIATAADKAAAALYQSEVSTKGASVAYDDANAKLAQEKDAFEQAAEKAGFGKSQVQALADELFKLPPSTSVMVEVSTAAAKKGVEDLIKWVDSQTGKIDVYENSAGVVFNPGSGGAKAHAAGGFAPAGEVAIFGEQGPEIGIPRQGYDIIPAPQTARILAGAAPMPGTGPAGTGPMTVNQYYYGPAHPTAELRAQMGHELATVLGGL